MIIGMYIGMDILKTYNVSKIQKINWETLLLVFPFMDVKRELDTLFIPMKVA